MNHPSVNPMSGRVAQLHEAERLLARGDNAGAASLLQTFMDHDAEALLLLARALHNLSRHEEAAEACRAAAKDPDFTIPALARLAMSQSNMGHHREAVQTADQALDLDALCVEAWKNKAQALLALEQVNEAHQAATQALELSPDYPEGHLVMGLVRMMQMHLPDAEGHFRRALELAPELPGAYAKLGFFLRRCNRIDEALEMLERAVALRPEDHVSRGNLALALIDAGRRDAAREHLLTCIGQAPDSCRHRANLAALYRRMGRLEDAERQCSEILAIDPAHKQTLFNLPALLLDLGKPHEAHDAARAVTERFPENPTGFYNLAVSLLHLRRFSEAEGAALRALELGMDTPALYLSLAQARQLLGRYENALEAAAEALKRKPDAKSHFSMGMALEELGRLQEAAGHFEKSIEFDPQDIQGAVIHLRRLKAGAEISESNDASLSTGYLQRLFDQYAGTYDDHLRGALQYKGPELLGEALAPFLKDAPDARILDLGCGTGLCAPMLRPMARELVGVDLSENMMRKAAACGLYDRLVCAEACAFLEQETPGFHGVAAGDVLVYLGELTRLFSGIARILLQGGIFAFTVEKQDAQGFSLGAKGRFRYSKSYLEAQTLAAGLTPCIVREASIRSEEKQPVPGWVAVVRKER